LRPDRRLRQYSAARSHLALVALASALLAFALGDHRTDLGFQKRLLTLGFSDHCIDVGDDFACLINPLTKGIENLATLDVDLLDRDLDSVERKRRLIEDPLIISVITGDAPKLPVHAHHPQARDEQRDEKKPVNEIGYHRGCPLPSV